MRHRKMMAHRRAISSGTVPQGASRSGFVAKGPLRELYDARHRAHLEFDRLWDRGPVHIRRRRRNNAYKWLRHHTGMSEDDCHFSQFDIGVCEAVMELVKQARVGLIPMPSI